MELSKEYPTHYALDLETPPVIACDAQNVQFTSTIPSEVTCEDCIGSEMFPQSSPGRFANAREFKFTVRVKAMTRQQAERVMGERIFTDADYGFPYEIWVMGAANDPGKGN
jgi:hypothetical protein